MGLAAGARLGPYEIVSKIGAGGFGDVFRARDSRLNRTVAIKVLADAHSGNPQLRQRLEIEAQAIAKLNHPHICHLNDVGHADGIDYLVMEYLEGETLAEALSRYRAKSATLPIDQVLRYADQIADALAEAHRHGVVHRDLKPANVFVTASGVKLLDFGLARLRDAPTPRAAGVSTMPPQHPQRPFTESGAILGTWHYMSPEQLEGIEADARADVFAFGAVLYEMLTGRRAFDGGSQASIIAAILEREPPAVQEQSGASHALDRVIRGCLAKNRDERWQDMRDVRRALHAIADDSRERPLDEPAPRQSQGWRGGIAAAVLVAAVSGATAIWIWKGAGQRAPAIDRLSIPLPAAQPYWSPLAISPDGDAVVYALGRPPNFWLHIRALDQFTATRIEGTGGGQFPFYSPDGRWVGFLANGEVRKAPVEGGSAIPLCEATQFLGGTWGLDGTIVFSAGPNAALFRVSADNGPCEALTTIQPGEQSHRHPEFLPDGKNVLFAVTPSDAISYDDARIEVVSLATGERRVVLEGARRAWYAGHGRLVFARAGRLFAVPFDLEQRRTSGTPVPVVSGVAMDGSRVHAAISNAGVLAYVSAEELLDVNARRLVWIDRKGDVRPVRDERRGYLWPRISPDGRQMSTIVQGPNNTVWVHDVERGTFTRVPSQGDVQGAVWTPDSKRLLYSSTTTNGEALYETMADGSGDAQLVYESAMLGPASVSPDGAALAIVERATKTGDDIAVVPLQGDRKARPFLNSPAREYGARISPDGRWLAYASNEAGRGRYEVYVRAFPGAGERIPISPNGGRAVAWAASGRELFYRELDRMMVVDVRTAPTFTAAVPRPLFTLQGRHSEDFDVTPDGQRFVLVEAGESAPPSQINVVLNWSAELRRLVPAR